MSFNKQEKKFLSAASTSVILPQNTKVPLAQALQGEDGAITIQDIKQRDNLFFDERLTAYAVLQIPQCSEQELQLYLSRLDFKLEVWAISDNNPDGKRSPSHADPVQDLIFTGVVSHNEDPIVLVSQNENEEGIYLNLIWEVNVVLDRPRIRLHNAHTTFIPIASVKPEQGPRSDEIYLEPFQPQVVNLFEPLKGSRGFENDMPYLPITRLDAVSPLSPKENHLFHLRSIPSRSIPTHLAFITRLRYTKASYHNITMTMTATLEVEMIPFIELSGVIQIAEATLQKGRTNQLTQALLPMQCQSRDCMAFLYQLEEDTSIDSNLQGSRTTRVDVLSVKIKMNLELSNNCQPVLETYWTTNIDFAQFAANGAHTPGADDVSNQMVKSSQVLSMSMQPVFQHNGFKSIIISFAASVSPVEVAVPFSWKVLIVNKTAKPVKLAIIPLPRIQKPTSQAQQYAKRHATRSSTASTTISEKNAGEKSQVDVAQAVVDENIVYAMQHSGAVPPDTDLMAITPELRIGPLGPGQCHEDEIKLVAFKSGAFTLDTIRVVDLVRETEQGFGSPGVVMDIRELPDVIVSDK